MSTFRYCAQHVDMRNLLRVVGGHRWLQMTAQKKRATNYGFETVVKHPNQLQSYRNFCTIYYYRPNSAKHAYLSLFNSTIFPFPAVTTSITTALPSLFPSQYFGTKSSPDRAGKSETKSASIATAENDIFADTSNLGLFAKFKLMYKKYWYVMVPVHCITSCFWYGGFYYLSKSGVDVPSMLQFLHLSETIIEKVQQSDMGHLAVAYLCYKVATPLRYAVTLGGTTVSIKYLVQAGHIKPMPTKEELIKMYELKKANLAATKTDKGLSDAEKSKQGKYK